MINAYVGRERPRIWSFLAHYWELIIVSLEQRLGLKEHREVGVQVHLPGHPACMGAALRGSPPWGRPSARSCRAARCRGAIRSSRGCRRCRSTRWHAGHSTALPRTCSTQTFETLHSSLSPLGPLKELCQHGHVCTHPNLSIALPPSVRILPFGQDALNAGGYATHQKF